MKPRELRSARSGVVLLDVARRAEQQEVARLVAPAEPNRAAEEARIVKSELLQRQDATDRKIERVEEKVDAILLELRRRR